MTVVETLRVVLDALDGAGIRHTLAGSMASSFHGEPRSTQDVNLVVDPPSEAALDRFVAALADRFFVGDHRAACTAESRST